MELDDVVKRGRSTDRRSIDAIPSRQLKPTAVDEGSLVLQEPRPSKPSDAFAWFAISSPPRLRCGMGS